MLADQTGRLYEMWLISELDAAQLSLFPTAVLGGGDDAEMQTLNLPSPKGMYNANQCLYLEKLLGESYSVALSYTGSITRINLMVKDTLMDDKLFTCI